MGRGVFCAKIQSGVFCPIFQEVFGFCKEDIAKRRFWNLPHSKTSKQCLLSHFSRCFRGLQRGYYETSILELTTQKNIKAVSFVPFFKRFSAFVKRILRNVDFETYHTVKHQSSVFCPIFKDVFGVCKEDITKRRFWNLPHSKTSKQCLLSHFSRCFRRLQRGYCETLILKLTTQQNIVSIQSNVQPIIFCEIK